jgi:HEAT repeat protein
MRTEKLKNEKKAKKGFLNNILDSLKKLYDDVSDLTITDLSVLSNERAVEYIDRIDLSRLYTIKVLKTSVKHPNPKVVIKGIRILKQLRTLDSKKSICTALNRKELNIVLEAIEALKLFAQHEVEKPLIACLFRKDKKIANAALWALAEIKTPEALAAIEGLAGNDSEFAQTASWIINGNKSFKYGKKLRA